MKQYFLFFILLFIPFEASAATLFGKVIEVSSGDVITIFNLNRPVRVKLLGVDAPELAQPFGDVAKKHLSDLVYDQSVLVEYSGIAADRSLTGRVLLNNADIGAQMIRDGAAWVDSNNQDRLSATDREVYLQSERAARSERRGLWQMENPMAPWDFVKAEALRMNPYASLKSMFPYQKPKPDRPTPELTNLTLMTARNASDAGGPTEMDPRLRWTRTAESDWLRFRPAGERFSALVPADGEQMTTTGDEVPPITYHGYLAKSGWARYAIYWVKLPTDGESDQVAIAQTLKLFLEGFGQTYKFVGASRGLSVGYSCELDNQKDVSMNGFVGSEFDLKSCTVPGKARIFTRLVGGQRQMYLAIAFNLEEDPNVKRFINSFIVSK